MKRVFLAGATGAVGQPLCRLLVAGGYHVVGATRSPDKAAILEALGVEPVVVDVFDEAALCRAVMRARPDHVIHQLTDLPPGLDPARMDEARARNARLREIGTRNLIDAAIAGGARRFVAQSIAFVYAPGPKPFSEESLLDTDAPDPLGMTARAIENLELQVLEAPMDGLLLRYGKFYGPGTGFDAPASGGALHVHDAARAAFLALSQGAPGVYNVAEDDGTVSSLKAARELGWQPGYRLD
jgi:nucleoside-diphosphate-sugar epimerase